MFRRLFVLWPHCQFIFLEKVEREMCILCLFTRDVVKYGGGQRVLEDHCRLPGPLNSLWSMLDRRVAGLSCSMPSGTSTVRRLQASLRVLPRETNTQWWRLYSIQKKRASQSRVWREIQEVVMDLSRCFSAADAKLVMKTYPVVCVSSIKARGACNHCWNK